MVTVPNADSSALPHPAQRVRSPCMLRNTGSMRETAMARQAAAARAVEGGGPWSTPPVGLVAPRRLDRTKPHQGRDVTLLPAARSVAALVPKI